MCGSKTRDAMRTEYKTLTVSQHLIGTRFEGEKRVEFCRLLARPEKFIT
jgi:hypothetical protein